jgi:hypothetical protein
MNARPDEHKQRVLDMAARWPNLMDKLKVAHVCPAADTGNPADCAFGGEGCMSESQIKTQLEGE